MVINTLNEIAQTIIKEREECSPQSCPKKVSDASITVFELTRACKKLGLGDPAQVSRNLYLGRYYKSHDDWWFVKKLMVRVNDRVKDILSFR